MQLLQRAVANGFRDVDYLKDNRNFEPLRKRADFEKLLSLLESRVATSPR